VNDVNGELALRVKPVPLADEVQWLPAVIAAVSLTRRALGGPHTAKGDYIMGYNFGFQAHGQQRTFQQARCRYSRELRVMRYLEALKLFVQYAAARVDDALIFDVFALQELFYARGSPVREGMPEALELWPSPRAGNRLLSVASSPPPLLFSVCTLVFHLTPK
jgi:hypothetical protein